MAIFHFPLFFSSALIITTSSTWIFIGFSLYFWLRLSFSTTKSCHLFHALSLHRLMYLYNFLQLHLSSSGKSSNSLTSMSTIWKGMHSSVWFLGSLLNRVPFVSCLQVWSRWPLANVPKAWQTSHFCVPTYQCDIKLANVPKTSQLFNLACQLAKGVPVIQLGVPTCQSHVNFSTIFQKKIDFWIFHLCLTFANFMSIWAILENLSREAMNLNFDICKIPLRKNLINLP